MEEVALERTFAAHKEPITCLAFVPSSVGVSWDQVVSGSADGTLKIHNFKENLRPFEFNKHTGAVRAVAVSPGAEVVASGGDDRTVRLWRPKVNTGVGISLGGRTHAGTVRSLAFSASGETLATASDDKMVKLWDIPEARFRCTLSGHSNWVRSVAIHPNNSQLIGSCGDDKTVRLWDAAQKRPYLTLSEHTSAVNSLAFSPDGLLVAAGSADCSVKLWDLRTGRLFQHFGPSVAGWWETETSGAVNSVCFHPSGNFLLSGGDDATLKLLDLPEGRVCCTIQGHYGPVQSTAFSETGEMFCSGGNDQSVAIWVMSPDLTDPVEPPPRAIPIIDDGSHQLGLKESVGEIKRLTRPPMLVKAVMEAVGLLFGQPPSWSQARILLSDTSFPEQLLDFDATTVPLYNRQLLEQYMQHPDFCPEVVAKVSAAACTLCLWVQSAYAAILALEEERAEIARCHQELEQEAAPSTRQMLNRPRSAGRAAARAAQAATRGGFDLKEDEDEDEEQELGGALWLERNDLSELKSLHKPPTAVVLVCEAVCILLQAKGGPSWQSAKQLIHSRDFLAQVNGFDPASITPRAAHQLAKYIANPAFAPEVVSKKGSKAAYGLCLWVTYMYTQAVTGQSALTPGIYRSGSTGAADSPGRSRQSPTQAWALGGLDSASGSSDSGEAVEGMMGGPRGLHDVAEELEEDEDESNELDTSRSDLSSEDFQDDDEFWQQNLSEQETTETDRRETDSDRSGRPSMTSGEAINWTLQNMAQQLDVLTRTMVTLEGRLSTVETTS